MATATETLLKAQPETGGGRDSPPSPRPRPTLGNVLVAQLVYAAAAVHLWLTPEHFEEGLLFGAAFLAIAGFQLWLAWALVLRPGPWVYRAGLWGSAAVVLTWMGTRLIPPPGAGAPEPVDLLGVVATGMEIAAIVALASSLPSVGARPGPWKRRALAAGAGIGFSLLVLFASGAIAPLPPRAQTGELFSLAPWRTGYWRFNGFLMVVGGRWSAVVPWLTVGFVVPAGLLVAWTVSLAQRLPRGDRCSGRRRGVLAAVPACATVPVCCSFPVTAFAGWAAVGTLFRWTPWLMGASLVLLAGNALLLRRRLPAAAPAGEVEGSVGSPT